MPSLALRGGALNFFSKGSSVQTEYAFALALLHYGLSSLLYADFSLKKFAGSQEKRNFVPLIESQNIALTMLQRRMNNWNTVSDRGIKCLEVLSCVHTSGIGAFYFRDIFPTSVDRPSVIR